MFPNKFLFSLFLISLTLPATSFAENDLNFPEGLYVGGQVGLGSLSSQTDKLDWARLAGTQKAVAEDHEHDGGSIAGLNVGYNHHINTITYGIELTLSKHNGTNRGVAMDVYVDQNGALFNNSDELLSATKLKSTWVLAPKMGFLFDEKTMIYVKAGFAQGEVERTLIQSPDVTHDQALDYGSSVSQTKTLHGYTVGFGVERMLSEHTSIKFQYDYIDLCRTQFSPQGGVGNGQSVSITEQLDITHNAVTVGLNYHF